MNEEKTYTYFAITGNFTTKDIIQLLKIEPIEAKDIGDKGIYKDKLDFARIELVKSDKDTMILEEQVEEVVNMLKPKIDILKKIYDMYDVTFAIETVAYLSGDIMPAITYNKNIIEFCYLTNSIIDCDLCDFRE